jgi:hypothetical protein
MLCVQQLQLVMMWHESNSMAAGYVCARTAAVSYSHATAALTSTNTLPLHTPERSSYRLSEFSLAICYACFFHLSSLLALLLHPAGTSAIHRELEQLVAQYIGQEDAITFGMGFATNAASIPAIAGPGSLVLSDALNHTSIVAGVKASGAKVGCLLGFASQSSAPASSYDPPSMYVHVCVYMCDLVTCIIWSMLAP